MSVCVIWFVSDNVSDRVCGRMLMCVHAPVCVRVCVCVCARARSRARARVCVCVCLVRTHQK